MACSLRRRAPFSRINACENLVVFLSLILSVCFASGTGGEEIENEEFFLDILRDEAVSRIYQLGKVSDANNYLERTFLSPASIRATHLIQSWMEDAGLNTSMDYMGNVHGRVEGGTTATKALLIGSHMDTVVDAGMFDGSLGIICAISVLKVLKVSGKLGKLNRPVEVIAFSDEEGVRFQTTFLGSAAMAGVLPISTLKITDRSGFKVQDALLANNLDVTEENFAKVKYAPESVFGYVEVHIEQGPVLESLAYPLGVVKGIAGQTRLKVTVNGSQGHAGTVPMFMRRDPMVAAADLIVLLESLCKNPQNFLTYDEHCNGNPTESFAGLVCTVGEISSWPSASNVIPGQVYFTVDIRALDDITREAIILEFMRRVNEKCRERSVNCTIEHKHNANAVHVDKELTFQLQKAVRATVSRTPWNLLEDVPVLMSGAGHDAMAMSHLTKIGMLFVRCRGGVSHSPEEHVVADDIWAAGLALLRFLEQNVLC